MKPTLTRRTFLRGSLGGVAFGLGLPVFDAFLNTAGTAWADGAPLPVRFGTWFWGCGMNPQRWNPTAIGTGWEITPELAPLAPLREHLNVLTGFDVAALVTLLVRVNPESLGDHLLPLPRIRRPHGDRPAEVDLEDHASEIEQKCFDGTHHIASLPLSLFRSSSSRTDSNSSGRTVSPNSSGAVAAMS